MAYHHYRNSYPLVSPNDTLIIVFESHGSVDVRPRVIVTAMKPDASVTIKSGMDFDPAAFTLTDTFTLSQLGQLADRELPITGAATINTVSSLTTTGYVKVDIESPIPVRSYFKQF